MQVSNDDVLAVNKFYSTGDIHGLSRCLGQLPQPEPMVKEVIRGASD
jgi:hypothetical protein